MKQLPDGVCRRNRFVCAFSGLLRMVKEERNARLHLLATVFVILFGIYFKISAGEWIAIVVMITLVLAAEAFNTALETLCDRLVREKDEYIGYTKDVAAGAVTITALGAVVVGCIIFVPKIWEVVSSL